MLAAASVTAQTAPDAPPIGKAVTSAELFRYFAIQPDGRGLPVGRGDVKTGSDIYMTKCAMCHGAKLEGIKETGAPALAGGRDKLKAVPPVKTVESYWPYASTLFDYIKRAMPFTQPGSLTNDEVYALCAFILAHGKIIPDDAVMDKTSLPKVEMPNRKGFVVFDNTKVLRFH